MGQVNNNAMFSYCLIQHLAESIRKDRGNGDHNEIMLKVCREAKKVFVDKIGNSETLNLEGAKPDKSEKMIKDQIEKDVKRLVKNIKVDKTPLNRELQEEFVNSLLSEENIHYALVNTVATKRFEDLSPNLKTFMLKYEDAQVNAKYYSQLLRKMERKGTGIWNQSVFDFKRSVSTDLKVAWERLSEDEKETLATHCGITAKEIQNLEAPLQKSTAATLTRVYKRISDQVSHLNEGKVDPTAKKKIKDDLTTLLNAMKGEHGKEFKKQYGKEVEELAKEVKKFGIEVDLTGTSWF